MADPLTPISESTVPSQGSAVATPQASAPDTAAAPAALSSPEVPVSAPAVQGAPETAPPAPEPAAAAEAAKVPEAPLSLLSEAKAKDAPAPAEAKPSEAEVKAPEPVALPAYEPFKLPEGVKAENVKLDGFTKAMGEFEVDTKADHAKMQAFGQRLLDMYAEESRKTADQLQKLQVDNWNTVRESWKDEFRNDPEIGGNRQETTLRECAAVLEAYGAKAGKERESAVRMALRVTGAGDNPEIIRLIHWASNYTTEKSRPVAATVPKMPQPTTKAQRRYSGSNSTNGAA